MSVSVTWYGHSNFKVSCGDVTVFIDPFFTHNPSCPVTWNEAGKPDLVLVTHDHGDHTGDAVAICKSSGATCGCIVGTAERLIDARDAASQHSRRDRLQYRGHHRSEGRPGHHDAGVPYFGIRGPRRVRRDHAGRLYLLSRGRYRPLLLDGADRFAVSAGFGTVAVGGFFTMDGLQAAPCRASAQAQGRDPHALGDIPGPCEGHLGLCVASRVRGSRCPPGLHEAR